MAIGPALPPHLATKRKREEEEEDDDDVSTSARSPRSTSSSDEGEKRRRVLGPALPPASLDESIASSNKNEGVKPPRISGPSLPLFPIGEYGKTPPKDEKKPQRVLGPSLPPAPLDERPTTNPNVNEDSESDDDLGPMPPVPGQAGLNNRPDKSQFDEPDGSASWEDTAPKKTQRDEWMLLPPTSDDWSSRVDPTKLKNRKFNTGKGAKAPADKTGGNQGSWMETPEQKRKRLEDEVLGTKSAVQTETSSIEARRSEAEARETKRRIREYNVGPLVWALTESRG